MPTSRIHSVNSMVCVLLGTTLGMSSIARAQAPLLSAPAPSHQPHSDALLPATARYASSFDALAELTMPSVVRLTPLPGQTECPVITAVAVSPDGQRIAAAGDDHAIRLVSSRDGAIEATWIGHRDWVQAMDFSPDGQMLASCAKDGTLGVWSIPQANSVSSSSCQNIMPEIAFHRVPHALTTVAFTAEQELFAAGFSDAIYRLDLASRQWNVDHRSDCRDIRTIAGSKDRKWLAYAGRDGVIRVLDRRGEISPLPTPSPREFAIAQLAHFDRVRCLCFTENDREILSVGEDRRLVRLDLATKRVLSQFDLDAGKLYAVQPLDGSLVAVSGSDNAIRIIDIDRNQIVAKLVGHDGSIAVLRRAAGSLISAGFDTTLRTWSLRRSTTEQDDAGRFMHPVAAQFEDSSAQESIR
jgi:WD40 repeat protein